MQGLSNRSREVLGGPDRGLSEFGPRPIEIHAPGRLRARIFFPFGAGLLLASALISPGWGADASAWSGDKRSSVRLVAGAAVGDPGGRILRAGIQMRLASGWKTYWRYPGDAGVPPLFDFSRSANVDAVTVLWPVPQRFSIEGVTVVGYSGSLIMPLRVVPRKASEAVTLRLKLHYGICEKMCVPATADAELALSGTASSYESALVDAESRVPKLTRLGQDGPLAIRAVRREGGKSRPRLVIDVTAPATARVDLFAEGPTPDWALPLPEPVPPASGDRRQFILELDGIPTEAAISGAMLKLTAASDGSAIEVNVPLN